MCSLSLTKVFLILNFMRTVQTIAFVGIQDGGTFTELSSDRYRYIVLKYKTEVKENNLCVQAGFSC